nr:MAG TPA: hypothetical protein [Bacteriophage sp.]
MWTSRCSALNYQHNTTRIHMIERSRVWFVRTINEEMSYRADKGVTEHSQVARSANINSIFGKTW